MPYKDKEKKIAFNKDWYEKNKKYKKVYNKAWEEKNKEERKAYYKSYYENNKEDKKAKSKIYREKNKEKVSLQKRNSAFKHYYGITTDQFFLMLKNQNNCCAICNKSETLLDKRTGKTRSLAVDHCHTTGKVRGLLCSNCNTSLGKFKDNIETLQSAINYLKKHNESEQNDK